MRQFAILFCLLLLVVTSLSLGSFSLIGQWVKEFRHHLEWNSEPSAIKLTKGERSFVFHKATSSTKRCIPRESTSSDKSRLSSWELAEYPGLPLRLQHIAWLGTLPNALKSLPSFQSEELSRFEFEDAALKVEYDAGTDRANTILFGRVNEYLGIRYAKRQSSPVIYLVPEKSIPKSAEALEDFVTNTPFAALTTGLESLSYVRGEQEVRFVRQDARWGLAEDPTLKLDMEVFYEFLDGIQDFKISTILTPPYSKEVGQLLGHPRAQLFLEMGGKQIVELEVYHSASEARPDTGYVRIRGCDCLFSGDVSRFLAKTAEPRQFRDFRIFSFDPQRVVSLKRVTTGGQVLKLARNAENWQVGEKNGDRVFIEEYLQRISLIRAEDEFAVHDMRIFASPVLTLFVELGEPIKGSDKVENRRESLVIAPHPDGQSAGWVAATDNMSKFFLLSRETLKSLLIEKEVLLAASKNS